MTTTCQRACYYATPDGQGEILLVADGHGMTDDELRDAAVAEARHAGLLGDEYPSLTEAALRAGLRIGVWVIARPW